MQRPSAEKLWQMPPEQALPNCPGRALRFTPLEVQAASYLAAPVRISSLCSRLVVLIAVVELLIIRTIVQQHRWTVKRTFVNAEANLHRPLTKSFAKSCADPSYPCARLGSSEELGSCAHPLTHFNCARLRGGYYCAHSCLGKCPEWSDRQLEQ